MTGEEARQATVAAELAFADECLAESRIAFPFLPKNSAEDPPMPARRPSERGKPRRGRLLPRPEMMAEVNAGIRSIRRLSTKIAPLSSVGVPAPRGRQIAAIW